MLLSVRLIARHLIVSYLREEILPEVTAEKNILSNPIAIGQYINIEWFFPLG